AFGLSDTRHVASPTLPARCCQCPCRQFGTFQHTVVRRYVHWNLTDVYSSGHAPTAAEITNLAKKVYFKIYSTCLVSNNHTLSHTRHHHLRA
ncbi:unnamed protein product, partial [Musa hybrid cultivar]